jgi:putative alpha-1,2-mannosidase
MNRFVLCSSLFVLTGLLSVPAASAAAAPAGQHADEVDPRIGTGGDGHLFPGATVPFGMIQLSPDTAMPDFKHAYKWAAGYQYGDPTIMGFSHTHFSGSGHSDLGDVLVMPIAGDVKLDPGDAKVPAAATARASITHRSGAGRLLRGDIERLRRARRTHRYGRVGWHRYTFPTGKPAHVLLDLRPSIYDYPGKVLWANLQVRADGTVTGCRTTRGWAPGRELCFAMRFSQPMTSRELYNRETDLRLQGLQGDRAISPQDQACAERPRAGRRLRFRPSEAAVAGEGGYFTGERGERHRQPRQGWPRLGFDQHRAEAMLHGTRRWRRSTSMARRRNARSSTPRCITPCWRRR